MSLSDIAGCVLSSWDQGVIKVGVYFQEGAFILFEESQFSSMLLYCCRWAVAMSGYGS